MTENTHSERTRRTFIKGAAATGIAATGITAFSGSAAAQEPTDYLTVSDDEATLNGEELTGSTVTIQQGSQNAQFEDLNVEFDDLEYDEDDAEDGSVSGVASGTVTGSVLPNGNANGNAAQEIDTDFEDAAFEAAMDEQGNPTDILSLEIPDLFLDLLGLIVELDLDLQITADEDGGLLGALLAALGGD